MKKIIELLSEKLNIEKKDLINKLGLKDSYSISDFNNTLGVYSIFETKEQNEEYIQKKLKNKNKEIEELNNNFELNKNNLENQKKEINNLKKQINEVLKTEWQKIGFKKDFDEKNIDFNNLDFQNLNKSLLNYAEKNGLEIKMDDYPKNNKEGTSEISNVKIWNNGVVTKN